MCGICGFAGFKDDTLLHDMAERITHRGPDSDGFYSDALAGLGMRRLKVIDLSTGDQPLFNEDKTIAVVFNGEIYNFHELKKSLQQKGHTFYTNSDTEVIVHAYEEYGDLCSKYFRGMFAFALWDKTKKKLVLSRDHTGIKPLYIASVGNNLVFGSEIKCLLQHPAIPRDIDYEALDKYLTLLYVPAPLSIFRNIRKLPPGHTLIWQNGKQSIQQYWDLSAAASAGPAAGNERALTEQLDALMKETIQCHMISDVPLGTFLSGGLDSSAIVAYMSMASSQPVKTFTIGYGNKDSSFNELEKARAVAKHFGCDHHEYIVEPNVVDLLPALVASYDEPFADSSSIPTYLVSQYARQNVTVALTGIGGDECFGGYPRYMGARTSLLYEFLPLALRKGVSGMLHRLPESSTSTNTLGRLKRFAKGGTLSPYERYLSWVSFYNAAEKEKLYSPELRRLTPQRNNLQPHLGYFETTDADRYLQKIFYVDVKTYLADDLLAMGDRMSMAHSLELRVPFSDYKMLEFAFQLPDHLRVRGGTLKYLMKKALAKHLPPGIITQRKQGFMIPIARWIKDEEILPLLNDCLSKKTIDTRGFFDYTYIMRMLDDHRSGRRNYSDQLWALLNFELWHRNYID